MKQAERDKIEAREHLANRLGVKPGDTVRTILRHVSASGMTRSISVIVTSDGEPYDASYAVAQLVGSRIDQKRGGVVRQGVGMDMGFDLVYSLSRAMFPTGFECIGDSCPSNDHSNGDRDYTPGHVRHKDGGYALKQRWL